MSRQHSQYPNGLGISFLLLLAGLLLPFDGKASQYTYTLIADTSDTFIALVRASINHRGSVAFIGNRGPDLDVRNNGVFVGDGRTFTTIALPGDLQSRGVGAPSINNAGQVAFQVFLSSGEESILAGNGRSLAPVIETLDTSFTAFGLDPQINNAGTVVFAANLDTGVSGVFTSNGGSVFTIADTTGGFSGFGGRPSINNGGGVAFSGGFDGGGVAIFASDRHGNLITIAIEDGLFNSIGPFASINDAGIVAFEPQPEGFPLLDGEEIGSDSIYSTFRGLPLGSGAARRPASR